MTFLELVEKTAARLGVKEERARSFLEDTFRTIAHAAKRGPVRIQDFGTFHFVTSKGRRILNPVTREPMRLPAQKALKFRAARAQKAKVER